MEYPGGKSGAMLQDVPNVILKGWNPLKSLDIHLQRIKENKNFINV